MSLCKLFSIRQQMLYLGRKRLGGKSQGKCYLINLKQLNRMVLDHWELLSLSSAFMKYSQVVFSGSSILLSRGKLTTSEHERLNTLAINFFEVSSVAKPSSPAEFRSIYKPDSNII
ncbi:unnamed protein product [Ceratitis capitata]|uniref:(Mediterranean fruit fly) hypothetical protein n=1 Tax=Ceratitis capitata TaxID=7213 RepID=A0A811UHC4_CERCA|nr:unnamed protein product [Ceratitis capitata]